MRSINTVENLLQDVRYAMRTFYKSWSFTVTAILALALGSGISISIYTLLDSVMFRPLPVSEPESVKKVYQKFSGRSSREVYGSRYMFSYPEYSHYRDHSQAFSDLIAYAETTFQIGGPEGISTTGLLVSDNYFSLLRARMILGRTFNPEEGRTPGTHPVAILSHRLWEQRYGSDRNVVGEPISVNGVALTVIGIAAADVVGLELTVPDLWVPAMMEPQVEGGQVEGGLNNLAKRNCSWLTMAGRLKDGVSMKDAQAELSVLASQLDNDFPGRKTEIIVSNGAYLASPEEVQVGTYAMIPVTIAVVFILLIACANVSNLFLARVTARRKEMAIRLALGATRGRLIRQLLTESILIGIIGGALGLLLTYWSLKSLVAMVPALPTTLNVTPSLSVFGYAIIISLVSGIYSGLPPAITATRLDVVTFLKDSPSVLSWKGRPSRLRNILLVAQVTICLVFLISTALLVRGLLHAQSVDLGFRPDSLYVATFDLRQQGYNNEKASVFFRGLLERLQATPEGKSASLAAVPPIVTRSSTVISTGVQDDSSSYKPVVYLNVVSPNYFETMGIAVQRGTGFYERDNRNGGAVAIVSESMAQRFWPEVDAIGKYFTTSEGRFEVVGVAKDVRNVQLSDATIPFFYSLVRPDNQLEMRLMLRADGNAALLSAALRSAVKAMDPNVTVSIQTMEEGLNRVLQPSKISILLSTALGLLALVLATIGVYGVTAYTTSLRTREIGIRMALGAKRSNILFLLIRQGVKPIVAGIILGIGLAAATSNLLLKLLFGLNALDPLAFLAACLFLAFVALVAIYLAASRAARVDPALSLR